MVGGTRRVPRWWLASRSETHTLGLERVKEAFPFNAEFPATSDPPELRTFQSGVRARSSTFLAGGSSPGDQLLDRNGSRNRPPSTLIPPPLRIRQNYGRFNLAFGHGPVLF